MYVFPGGLIEKHADFSNDWMELFKQSFAKFGTDFTTLVNIQLFSIMMNVIIPMAHKL